MFAFRFSRIQSQLDNFWRVNFVANNDYLLANSSEVLTTTYIAWLQYRAKLFRTQANQQQNDHEIWIHIVDVKTYIGGVSALTRARP